MSPSSAPMQPASHRRSSSLRAAAALSGALALAATALVAGGGSGRPPAAASALPACSATGPAPGGDWRAYGHDPANTRSQPDEHTLGTARAASLAPAWVFSVASVGDSAQFESTPLAADGCIFAAGTNGAVYALDAATGTLLWRHAFTVASPGLGGAIVGGAALGAGEVVVVVNESGDGAKVGPYLAALDEHSGAVLWTSAPMATGSGYYSNGTPQVIGGVVLAGFSPPEGDSTGQGGFVLVDLASGSTVKTTDTISAADQAKGFAGGGIWSTAAWDPQSGFAYIGAGNPYSKQMEDVHSNAILKIDMNPGSASFGDIVASYKGNVDQYTQALEGLSQTPLCGASASAPDPLDDPACGQLDLDFGAAPNLFTAKGHEVVGDLQKAGVYHVADASSMAPVWSTVVGATCQACNAASSAFDGSRIIDVSTPGGLMFALQRNSGARSWLLPLGDGLHYEATSVADGVAYTTDTAGFLDVVNAATGVPIMRRPMSLDTQFPTGALSSGGIAIAYHTVYVAASGGPGNGGPAAGFVIAYR
jgi:outer membrane protein assembly factor BamB